MYLYIYLSFFFSICLSILFEKVMKRASFLLSNITACRNIFRCTIYKILNLVYLSPVNLSIHLSIYLSIYLYVNYINIYLYINICHINTSEIIFTLFLEAQRRCAMITILHFIISILL